MKLPMAGKLSAKQRGAIEPVIAAIGGAYKSKSKRLIASGNTVSFWFKHGAAEPESS